MHTLYIFPAQRMKYKCGVLCFWMPWEKTSPLFIHIIILYYLITSGKILQS